MRRFLISLLTALLLCAPQINGQDNPRSLWLRLVNETGKPVKKTAVTYQIGSQSAVSKTDKNGSFLIDRVTDADTITLLVSGYDLNAFPAAGVDSVQVTLPKTKKIDDKIDIGYQSVSPQNSTLPVSQLTPDRNVSAYRDLASYLQGRSGLQIRKGARGSEVVIRGGNNSFHLGSGALIVVDGVTFDDFETVNNLISPNDVKNVNILKDGSVYGSRGANGVVIITTKRGRD